MIRHTLLQRLQRLWRREDGTATVEFAIFVPIVLTIFMASVEAGVYMIRHVMLERGLDLVMRDYRLGRLPEVTHNQLRSLICAASPIIKDCNSKMKVWVGPLNTTTWSMDTSMQFCGDRNGTLKSPDTGTVQNGLPDQPMFVRICVIQNPLFPTTGLGLKLREDSKTGGYQLASSTVVVNEPD